MKDKGYKVREGKASDVPKLRIGHQLLTHEHRVVSEAYSVGYDLIRWDNDNHIEEDV